LIAGRDIYFLLAQDHAQIHGNQFLGTQDEPMTKKTAPAKITAVTEDEAEMRGNSLGENAPNEAYLQAKGKSKMVGNTFGSKLSEPAEPPKPSEPPRWWSVPVLSAFFSSVTGILTAVIAAVLGLVAAYYLAFRKGELLEQKPALAPSAVSSSPR
jgi:hypothetical protein